MMKSCRYVQVALVAAVIIAAGMPAGGAVVALKDFATVSTGGNLDTTFSNAITGGSVTVYTNATADTYLSEYTSPASGAFWYNYGAKTSTGYIGSTGSTPLIRFDFSQSARLRPRGRGQQG